MQTPDAQITEFILQLSDREKSVLRSAATRFSPNPDFNTLCRLYFPGIARNQIAILQKYLSSAAT
jgi:hypothetical protein